MKNVDSQYDAFQIGNALMIHVISKQLTDMGLYCHVKQRKRMQDDQAGLEQYMGPGQCVRQATDAKRKLQSSHYGDESKMKVCSK